MEIFVTKHSIQRYRERLFDYSSTDEKIGLLLREIALKGKQVYLRPNYWNNCFELKHKGVSIVLLNSSNKAVVLTCLGDNRYRRWIQSSSLNKKGTFYRN